MARSGLTKAQVRTIRDRLLAAGRYPSVDAVRHALGDTGSKSTIHKYLKELAEEGAGAAGAVRREDTRRSLQDMVEELAGRLHEDAERSLGQLRAEHEQALRARDEELAALRATVATLKARIDELQAGAGPASRGWGGQGADGFGNFGGPLLNSRSGARAISPFNTVRTAARSEAFGFDGDWNGRKPS